MTLSIGNRRLEGVDIVRDEGSVIKLDVAFSYEILRDDAPLTTHRYVFDAWPNLTQGQRNQFQGIVDRLVELMEAW